MHHRKEIMTKKEVKAEELSLSRKQLKLLLRLLKLSQRNLPNPARSQRNTLKKLKPKRNARLAKKSAKLWIKKLSQRVLPQSYVLS